jgi:glycosyltransferase involved in cell wall biosynthesis
VLSQADAVIGVTSPIVEDVRARLSLDAELITNGYDPEDVPPDPKEPDPLLSPDRHSLVHTGRLSLSGVSLERLLDGVRMAREDPATHGLELVFAGSLAEEERRLLAAPDLAGAVRFVGWLERPRALVLQRAADTLLVVTEGAGRPSVATGKLFEYLSAGRPILVLGEETEAARIVSQVGSGFAVSASDPREIADALRRLVLDPPQPVSPAGVGAYAYPAIVERLEAVIDRVSSA